MLLVAAPGGAQQHLVTPEAHRRPSCWARNCETIDDRAAGRVTSTKLPVTAGSHLVTLTHPDYQPLRRRFSVVPGETVKLVIDMTEEAIRIKR